MRRIAIVVVVALLVLGIVAQFALPPIVENQVQDRLTKDGGSASVDISAFPAIRLLFTEGDSVRVRARELNLPLVSPEKKLLGQLDGFDDVDIQLTASHLGPLLLNDASLKRSGGDRPYRVTTTASVTARDVGAFGGTQAGGPLGGFLGGIAGGALPFGSQPVPINISAVVRSDGGQPVVVAVNGSIAGLPAGPLVTALAQALAGRF
jgi:hypothetical protein